MRSGVSVEKTTSSKPPTRIRPDRQTRIHQTNVSTIPSCRSRVHCALPPTQYQGLMDWCALHAHAARDHFGWLVEESKIVPGIRCRLSRWWGAGEAIAVGLQDSGLTLAVVERELVGEECPYWGRVPSVVELRHECS